MDCAVCFRFEYFNACMHVYIFRSRHSLSFFSFCIRHASTFPCSQCLRPPRRTASRVNLHQREAYVYVSMRARHLSHHRLIHGRARLPFRLSLSRPLYACARLPLWLTTALHSRALAIFVSRSLRCSRGKPARGHVDQTQPRMLPPFAIVPVLTCRQAPIA